MELRHDRGFSGIAVDRSYAGVGTILLRGEHDEYTSPKLAKTIASVLAKGLDVVVDLRAATFIDSTTVSVILAGQENAAAHDAGFVVVVSEETGWAVRRLFELTKLESVLTMVSTPEQAIVHLRERIGYPRIERRAPGERRSGRDRRTGERMVRPERRSGVERRSGRDRRAA